MQFESSCLTASSTAAGAAAVFVISMSSVISNKLMLEHKSMSWPGIMATFLGPSMAMLKTSWTVNTKMAIKYAKIGAEMHWLAD